MTTPSTPKTSKYLSTQTISIMDTQAPDTANNATPDLSGLRARDGQTHTCSTVEQAISIIDTIRSQDLTDLQRYHTAVANSHPAIIAQARQEELARLDFLESQGRSWDFVKFQDNGKTVLYRGQKLCFPSHEVAREFVELRRERGLRKLEEMREEVRGGDGEFFEPERMAMMASVRGLMREWRMQDGGEE